MYCKKCGAYVPDGQSVCPNCGVDNSNTDSHVSDELKDIVNSATDPLYDDSMKKTVCINTQNIHNDMQIQYGINYQAPAPPPSPVSYPMQEPVGKRSNLTTAVVCILIVLIIAVVVMMVVVFSDGGSTEKVLPQTPSNVELSVKASSTLDDYEGCNYRVSNLFDENNTTCWTEGVKGDGVGETITIESKEAIDVKKIVIDNGYCKSSDLFNKNNRVKTLRITFDDSKSETVELSDGYDNSRQEFEFQNIKASKITVEIIAVYRGTKYNDTCISGLMIY